MSRITLVVAVAKNVVIGRDGGLPWRLPSDLKRFKAATLGKPVIMGRRTWDGLPLKPLPGRRNIVVTRNAGFDAAGAERAASLQEALKMTMDAAEVSIIGGGELYREALPRAHRVILTEVDAAPEGDTYFPALDPAQWVEISREEAPRGERDTASFTVRVLERLP